MSCKSDMINLLRIGEVGGKRNIRKVATWVMQSHCQVSLRVQLRWETKPYNRGTSVSFIFSTEELPKYKSRDVDR